MPQFLLFTVIEPKLPDQETTKTSRAEITLKSATLPRRKPTKTEVQVDIKPNVSNWICGKGIHFALNVNICIKI